MLFKHLSQNKTIGSAFLVGGTSIGAGMLALPLTTGIGGILYASLLFVVVFCFMLLSLFFLLEATMFSKKTHANLITICKERLGRPGEVVAWVFFLLLLYSVAAAYLSGGGSLMAAGISSIFHIDCSHKAGVFFFTTCFGGLVIFGMRIIDRVNRFCMLALLGCFFGLLLFMKSSIDFTNYQPGYPKYLWGAIPVIALSFTSHIIVPSLNQYLNGDLARLKKALIYGSIIPLIFYLVWNALVLGIIPLHGKFGILETSRSAYPIASLTRNLTELLSALYIPILVSLFSFFALITSFFGAMLSLYDFLADGFRISKKGMGKFYLFLLIFTPPLLFSLFFPHGFIVALRISGVFVAILYGFLPFLMVWKGRYIEKIRGPFRVFGGKLLLIILGMGSLLLLLMQIGIQAKWLPVIE